MGILKELFEMLRGNSQVHIEWEQQSQIKKVGYFTIDGNIIYGIRRLYIDHTELVVSNLSNNIVIYDFGYFFNGHLNYELIKDSPFPTQVINTVLTQVKEEVNTTDNVVIFLAKKNNDDPRDYEKRVGFYDSLLQLHSRRGQNYDILQFKLKSDEYVFCMCRHKIGLSKLDIIRLCGKLDDGWLNFANAKRVLKTLKNNS